MLIMTGVEEQVVLHDRNDDDDDVTQSVKKRMLEQRNWMLLASQAGRLQVHSVDKTRVALATCSCHAGLSMYWSVSLFPSNMLFMQEQIREKKGRKQKTEHETRDNAQHDEGRVSTRHLPVTSSCCCCLNGLLFTPCTQTSILLLLLLLLLLLSLTHTSLMINEIPSGFKIESKKKMRQEEEKLLWVSFCLSVKSERQSWGRCMRVKRGKERERERERVKTIKTPGMNRKREDRNEIFSSSCRQGLYFVYRLQVISVTRYSRGRRRRRRT